MKLIPPLPTHAILFPRVHCTLYAFAASTDRRFSASQTQRSPAPTVWLNIFDNHECLISAIYLNKLKTFIKYPTIALLKQQNMCPSQVHCAPEARLRQGCRGATVARRRRCRPVGRALPDSLLRKKMRTRWFSNVGSAPSKRV